jgi:putative membrane protein
VSHNRRKTLSLAVFPGLIIGLALFTAIIAYQGIAQVAIALAGAGWWLLAVALFHVVPMFADSLAWRSLLSSSEGRPPLSHMLWARWICESVNELLPMMQLGGNFVRAHLITKYGVPGPKAGASVVVDITLLVFSQILFTFVGLFLLLVYLRDNSLTPVVISGMGLMALMLGGFYIAQRRGLFRLLGHALERLFGGQSGTSFVASAAELDAEVGHLYQTPRRIIMSSFWHSVALLVGSAEVWFIMHLLGHPVDIWTALLLESLGQAVRSAAFAIPAGLGVQEGGFLLLGTALGFPPDIALALSLAKRARELVMGLPGLVAWQFKGWVGYYRKIRDRGRTSETRS